MRKREYKEVKIKFLGIFSLECKHLTFKEIILLVSFVTTLGILAIALFHVFSNLFL